ncbi:hypothetical protein [Amycolatopsis coloradensis]|uniref:hypothetical protein n=1 Tax=Amycolatopsis coloradensis TaxID=76021 RepID=UPI001ABF07E0|nr:hypothetical protein [Amycolatopsis coloradensis]
MPLPGYDHLPQGSLADRVRALDDDDVRRILDYERGHADRPAVIEMHLRPGISDGSRRTRRRLRVARG